MESLNLNKNEGEEEEKIRNTLSSGLTLIETINEPKAFPEQKQVVDKTVNSELYKEKLGKVCLVYSNDKCMIATDDE